MKHLIFIFITILFTLNSCNQKNTAESQENSTYKKPISKSLNKSLVHQIQKNNTQDTFLRLVSPSKTGITFKNEVKEDIYNNHDTNPQIYNGAGLAIGDINNDGLPDIFFAGNSSKDQLYLNQGDFKFKNITESSGIAKENYGWSYGVNMVDVNADGYLDIYVCKAGVKKEKKYLRNRLFINNGDATFTEQALKYGISSTKLSVQSTFFDYDKDGDLDLYLANYPPHKKMNFNGFEDYVSKISNGTLITDQFFENNNGKFIEKTKEAKLFNYGYKNSIGVGDFNQDGYPDLYVCTDYKEPDLYFINNKNKTFSNQALTSFNHITFNSMGNDIADINNDGLLDIYVTDMTPSDHIRSKIFMATMDTNKFNLYVKNNFHHQYMLNSLQLNNGNNTFREIGQLAHIDKTDWSWAPLFFDIDLDGNKDLFVTNGIRENINENDLKAKIEAKQKKKKKRVSLEEFLEIMHTEIIPNQVYKNNGKLQFKNTSKKWIDKSNFNSNGAAYADLDNDGDLDLVLNNMDAIASVYENKAPLNKAGNSLAIVLKGPKNNPFALGTKITIPLSNQTIYHEHYPARGYLSSVDYKIILGLGNLQKIPKLILEWPDGKTSTFLNLEVNQELTINYKDTKKDILQKNKLKPNLKKIIPKEVGISFKHQEDKINDFKKQVLLPYSQSQNGPFIDVADVNNDHLVDFYVGGAAGSPGELYLQNKNGSFIKTKQHFFEEDKNYEDQGVLFFDFDGDQDLDLYVTSGGAAFSENNQLYQDRLYTNDGNGNFSKSNALPENKTSTLAIVANDVDQDGDLDLFVGGRVIPDKYPFTPQSQLLINENGIFINKTKQLAPQLQDVGLVTDAIFSDYDQDGDSDLIITAEWSPIKIFNNQQGVFKLSKIEALHNTEGIWFSVKAIDLDQDGDQDYLFGNLGLNSKFKATPEKPFHVFCDDFDQNGTYDIVLSKKYKNHLVPMRGKQCSSEQMPFIGEKFKSFQSFAEAGLNDIIGKNKLDHALHLQAKEFHSISLINNGDGTFKKINLPIEAQFAPILNFTFADINQDQQPEIIAIGNLYTTEVETTRYDASIGTVLQYQNNKFSVIPASKTGLRLNGDTKDAAIIKNSKNNDILIITRNNQSPEIYQIPKK
ncbi:MAG: VCBS repeat-containing protein [Flavobacteriales bacterium]